MLASFRAALLGGALLAAVLATLPASGKDVYKPFLDPAIPHHAAILDTLAKLEKEPGAAALHNDLGCLVAWDGFWRDALRSFETAAELDGKDSRPLFNAGLVNALRGEWGAARSRFKKAVKVDPGNWQAWWMLGYAYENLGSVDAAVDAYARSLRVDTSLFDPKLNPFAVGTRLRARVLLETYEQRRVDAALALTNQLAEPARVAGFFQAAVKAPAPARPSEEVPSGPVVTSVPAPGTSSPGAAAAPPAAPSSRRRSFSERVGRERMGPVEIAPEAPRQAPEAPEAVAAPPPEAGAGEAPKGEGTEPSSGPGMPVMRRTRPTPHPVPTPPPDPE